MPQSLANIQVLLTYSTKHCMPFLDGHLQRPMFQYLSSTCKALDCDPIKIGGHVDHIHIYCQLSKKVALTRLMQELKSRSSTWAKSQGKKYENFYWQEGYHAITVNPKQADQVIQYIDNQAEHHRKKTYQEECRLFFRKFKLAYNEKYVWD